MLTILYKISATNAADRVQLVTDNQREKDKATIYCGPNPTIGILIVDLN